MDAGPRNGPLLNAVGASVDAIIAPGNVNFHEMATHQQAAQVEGDLTTSVKKPRPDSEQSVCLAGKGDAQKGEKRQITPDPRRYIRHGQAYMGQNIRLGAGEEKANAYM